MIVQLYIAKALHWRMSLIGIAGTGSLDDESNCPERRRAADKSRSNFAISSHLSRLERYRIKNYLKHYSEPRNCACGDRRGWPWSYALRILAQWFSISDLSIAGSCGGADGRYAGFFGNDGRLPPPPPGGDLCSPGGCSRYLPLPRSK